MNKIVLDASALLAVLNREPGDEQSYLSIEASHLHQEGCPAARERGWRVVKPMDRGSVAEKRWSRGNRRRLFQETGRQGRRGRTHEVSSYRTQTRARAG